MNVPGTAWIPSVLASLPQGARDAVAVPFLLPGQVLGLLDEVTALVATLRESAARVSVLLDDLEQVPAQVRSLLGDLKDAPDRVHVLLADLQDVPAEVHSLLGDVGGRTGALIDDLQGTIGGVQPTLQALQQSEPLLRALGNLDPGLIADIASVVPLLPPLLERIDVQVLPAVSALEGLVPVVAKLSTMVDNLEHQVLEWGSLVGGIPGASRLLKRGERDARQRGLPPKA